MKRMPKVCSKSVQISSRFLYQREIGLKFPLGVQNSLLHHTYSSLIPKTEFSTLHKTETSYGGIFNFEFSPDGSIMIAACEQKCALLFDPLTRTKICGLHNAHTDCVNCIRFLDTRMFCTCSDDTTVALWDVRNLKYKIRTLKGHSNWVKNIEYAKEAGLLVTSGFDGSIYTWDINSYTEDGLLYNRVFHTNGLMRTRLVPAEDKLVIGTTGGYLLIIHDLDLNTLSFDLSGFKPNLYHLMQISQTTMPLASNFSHLFTSKRNRVELVSDFPDNNIAEVVSSLQIHPQGWCVLSRNTSIDELSEWSCIHDIQDNIPTVEDNNSCKTETSTSELISSIAHTEYPRSFWHITLIGAGMPEPDATHEFRFVHPSYLEALHMIQMRRIEMNHRTASGPVQVEEESVQTNEERNISSSNSSTLAPSQESIPRSQHTYLFISTPTLNTNTLDLSQQKIHDSKPRLLYYIEEPNVGRGFIKEQSFSPDGRLVCSPFGFGIRLLAFDSECTELSLCNPNKPVKLTEIATNLCHNSVVVSTKFSPTHHLLVSGCLSGKIVWHDPVF